MSDADTRDDVSQHVVTNSARGKMLTHTASELHIRDLPVVISDEPPSRGGENLGPSPLEYALVSLCACVNVSTHRMAKKIRFEYEDLETFAEGVLDTRGRKGLADVPVHYKALHITAKIKTEETDKRLERLIELVERYCPVHSLMRAAIPDFVSTWERM